MRQQASFACVSRLLLRASAVPRSPAPLSPIALPRSLPFITLPGEIVTQEIMSIKRVFGGMNTAVPHANSHHDSDGESGEEAGAEGEF